jgi:hypothetical protein
MAMGNGQWAITTMDQWMDGWMDGRPFNGGSENNNNEAIMAYNSFLLPFGMLLPLGLFLSASKPIELCLGCMFKKPPFFSLVFNSMSALDMRILLNHMLCWLPQCTFS